jgi:nicotinate-nucleotide adenylyltransferase
LENKKLSGKYFVIYGGVFDPPHKGHAACVSALLKIDLCDEIILVPSGDGRYDKKPSALSEHRIKMLEIFCKENFPLEYNSGKIVISSVQCDGSISGESYGIDLVNHFSALKPNKKAGFLIGSDNLAGLSSWKRYDELAKKCKFFVLNRPGSKNANKPANIDCIEVAAATPDISSSKIRELCVAGSYPEAEIISSAGILEYIFKNKLYLI